MNLSDLTEVLRDHAPRADAQVTARLAGVRARVAASRRRRAVGAAACVVLALVGVVYAVVPRAERSSEPATPERSFPEYQAGTRLAAQAWAELPSSSVVLRFVPKSLDFKVFVRCDIGQGVDLPMKLVIDGDEVLAGGCGTASGSSDWGTRGAEVGKPVVVTLTVGDEAVDHSRPSSPVTMPRPSSGAFGIAVGEAVPVDRYPFPPRPETLAEMPPPLTDPTFVVSADPADPDSPREFSIAWPGERFLHAQVNTPGRVRVLVNDVLVTDFFSWDYGIAGTQSMSSKDWGRVHGIAVAAGDPVRITVIPERLSGDWRVWLGEY
ncbi:hypothetical protein ACFFQW_25215 [Umezawaea endophytica]|uniref:Uncharacterized protein n=1 Tax=Umezawaea endophytica TaxID=1654476 RepID=A0A9X2VMP3_9PSEU|nr:hypothetical protein [Umezawaea endophytica]MCS7479425.1 hypothetical protein [Umezawaea endophytica]